MKLLRDTCVFLWLALEPARFSPVVVAAFRLIVESSSGTHVEVVCQPLKHRAGKLPLPQEPRRWMLDELQFHGVRRVPIFTEALFVAVELQGTHRVRLIA